jgi:hypothetical protein
MRVGRSRPRNLFFPSGQFCCCVTLQLGKLASVLLASLFPCSRRDIFTHCLTRCWSFLGGFQCLLEQFVDIKLPVLPGNRQCLRAAMLFLMLKEALGSLERWAVKPYWLEVFVIDQLCFITHFTVYFPPIINIQYRGVAISPLSPTPHSSLRLPHRNQDGSLRIT